MASTGVRRESPQSGNDIRNRRLFPQVCEDLDSPWPGWDSSPTLDTINTTLYQSVAALINFVSLDSPDLMFSIKEVMRHMSSPTGEDMTRLKRVVRFLRTATRYAAQFLWHQPSHSIEVYCDSDHAGCPVTRKSTLGGCVTWGVFLLKHGRKLCRYSH